MSKVHGFTVHREKDSLLDKLAILGPDKDSLLDNIGARLMKNSKKQCTMGRHEDKKMNWHHGLIFH